MGILLWLLISLLGAGAVGCIVGAIWGKVRLKRDRGELKPLLTRNQRIICVGSVVFGLACVFFALLYNPAAEGDLMDPGMGDGWYDEDGWSDGEDFYGDEVNPGMDLDDGEAMMVDLPLDGDFDQADPDGADLGDDAPENDTDLDNGEEADALDDGAEAASADTPVAVPRSSGGRSSGGRVVVGGSGGSVEIVEFVG